MKTSEKAAVLFLSALFAAAWGFGYSDYEDIFDATYPLDAGGTVSLENINGDVTIEVWDSPGSEDPGGEKCELSGSSRWIED